MDSLELVTLQAHARRNEGGDATHSDEAMPFILHTAESQTVPRTDVHW